MLSQSVGAPSTRQEAILDKIEPWLVSRTSHNTRCRPTYQMDPQNEVLSCAVGSIVTTTTTVYCYYCYCDCDCDCDCYCYCYCYCYCFCCCCYCYCYCYATATATATTATATTAAAATTTTATTTTTTLYSNNDNYDDDYYDHYHNRYSYLCPYPYHYNYSFRLESCMCASPCTLGEEKPSLPGECQVIVRKSMSCCHKLVMLHLLLMGRCDQPSHLPYPRAPAAPSSHPVANSFAVTSHQGVLENHH